MKKIVKIKRALISLSDKSDLKKILDNLSKYKIKLISSGGTYKKIKKLGFNCTELSDYTGFNEMLDGRVKTLHPKIHAGILSVRKNKKHRKELKFNKFEEIDLILVNFYPFEKVINQTNNFTKNSTFFRPSIPVNFLFFQAKDPQNIFQTFQLRDFQVFTSYFG